MDVDWFLKERTKFIRQYYALAIAPFETIISQIENGEEPYQPPYSDDGEPPFQAESRSALATLRLLLPGDLDTDADVSRPRLEAFGQRRSWSRWQSMQSVAHGSASRRSSGICFPQLVHLPYVPFSIRVSAASISASTCSEFSSSV